MMDDRRRIFRKTDLIQIIVGVCVVVFGAIAIAAIRKPMELDARVGKLEVEYSNMHDDISDIKRDIHELLKLSR